MKFSLADCFAGFEEPLEGCLEFSVAQGASDGEISFCVLDGAGEHVEVVVQLVEFVSCDDQFVGAQRQIGGSLPSHPVPLPAPLTTELSRAAWAGAFGENSSAPARQRPMWQASPRCSSRSPRP